MYINSYECIFVENDPNSKLVYLAGATVLSFDGVRTPWSTFIGLDPVDHIVGKLVCVILALIFQQLGIL